MLDFLFNYFIFQPIRQQFLRLIAAAVGIDF